MLTSLHVKNLALIEEEEIAFGEGLNILTGETGAGKSILLGALSLALGGKGDASMVGAAGDNCVVEAEFSVTDAIYALSPILSTSALSSGWMTRCTFLYVSEKKSFPSGGTSSSL